MADIIRYRHKLRGPLLGRIDLFIEVPRVEYDKLAAETAGEDSTAVCDRVVAASGTQVARLSGTRTTFNADMSARQVVEFCKLTPAGKQVLEAAMRQLHLSARAYHRVLKVARTIADLDHADRIDTFHLAEALQCRRIEGD